MGGGEIENEMTKATAFRQQMKVFTDSAFSPAVRSARLASVARGALADLEASGRASPRYRLFVDGQPATTESSVRGDGTGQILYSFSYLAEATTFALDFLQARAPAGSGLYRNSFWVGVNGAFVLAAAFNPDSVPPTAEIVIGNTQPYNRKVDVQMNGAKVLHFSVPPGEYADCVTALKRRFGNTLTAKRVYDMNFPGKYTLHHHQTRQSGRRAGAVLRSAGSFGQSPAIVINPIV